MSDQTIVCPRCSCEIKQTEAISAPIVERLRKQFEADARKKGEELARREQALSEKIAEIERGKEAIDVQVTERLKAERQRVAGEESKKAAEPVAKQITELRQQVEDKSKRIDDRRSFGLQLRPAESPAKANSRVESLRPGRTNVLQVIDGWRCCQDEVVDAVAVAVPEISPREFGPDNLVTRNEPV